MFSRRHLLLLYPFLLLFTLKLAGQSFSENGLQCGADVLRELRYGTHPAYRALDERLEQQWAKQASQPRRILPPPYILPIVFHIVHNNGPENISDADVLQSLEFTNQAFANSDYYDQGTGVNTNIQFCLARRSPDNEATTGINRLVAPEYVDLQATEEDRDMKDLLRWEPREYINVYVVREICGLGHGCGVAGYAYYPSAHGGRVDGIVVEARWLTGDEADASVLVHELGHYLGIRHTFDGGCVNDDCTTDGDRVCDTPPDQSKVAVPCSGSVNSCTTDTDSGFATDQNDMFINYMDYGYWGCYSAFTQGQADRMYFFLDGIRASLLDSPGCLDPCPAVVEADFDGGDVTVEIGTTLNFTNNSTNGSDFTWRINDNSEATTTDFSWLFDTEGNFTVTLFASGNPPLCQADSLRKRVRVICSLNAAFDPAGGTIVNVPRTFPNLSVLATNYSWQLDGTEISTDETLTYTFPNSGIFTLCLEASNNWCDDAYCRQLYVAPEQDTTSNNPNGCFANFAYSYQQPDNPESDGDFSVVIPDRAGGYYVGGTIGRLATVMHLAPDGSILWQNQLFPTGSVGVIKEMILDKDDMLAGIGQTQGFQGTVTTGQNFVFQIDPANGNLNWGKQYDQDSDPLALNTILHPAVGGPYTLIGTATESNSQASQTNGVFLKMSTSDGSVIGDIIRFSDAGSTTFDRVIYAPGSSRYFIIGDLITPNASGLLFTVLDQDGFFISSTVLETLIDPNHIVDIVADDVGMAVLTQAPVGVTGAGDLRLYTFNPSGDLATVTDYTGTGPLNAMDLTVNGSGYLLLGENDGGVLILSQVSRVGTLLWSRSLLYFNQLEEQVQLMALDEDEGILICGRGFTVTSGALPQLIKLYPDGTANGGCTQNGPYNMTAAETEIQPSPQMLIRSVIDRTAEDFFWEPGFLEFAGAECSVPCPEDEAPDCINPFLLSYDEGDAVTSGGFTAIAVSGNLRYVGGTINDRAYVAALLPTGEILWQHYFNLEVEPDDPQIIVSHLILDEEGDLVGIGRSHQASSNYNTFIFKISPAMGELVWQKEFLSGNGSNLYAFNDLFDLGVGDNYLVSGAYVSNSSAPIGSLSDGATFRIDRNTGELVNNTFHRYHGQIRYGFVDAVLSANQQTLYTLTNRIDNGFSRLVLTAIDLTSNLVIWSREYAIQANANTNLFGASLTRLDDKLFVLAERDDVSNTDFMILQTGTNDVTSSLNGYFSGNEYRKGQIAARDGEIVVQRKWINRQSLTKLNATDGSVIFARRYSDFFGVDNRANSLLVSPSQTLFTGSLFGMGGAVISVDSSGLQSADCPYQPTSISYETGLVPFNQFDLPEVEVGSGQHTGEDMPPLSPGNLFLSFGSCPQECDEPEELCDNQIDDDGDGLVDCEDPDLADDCCCLDGPRNAIGTDTFRCAPINIVVSPAAGVRFVHTNRNGVASDTLTGPFSLTYSEPGTYVITYIDQCLRTASDTITLHPRPRPLLDLRPDTTLCSNAIIPLLAQPGFADYEWVDGSQERSFTAYEPGTYWVIATDSCGGQQTDTVRVRIEPTTVIDLGNDTLICPGDTLTFSLSGFTEYQWSESTFIDCTNCPTVRFAPTSDTLLLVAATQGPGCFASDSLRVRVASPEGQNSSFDLCQGDTLLLGNQTITDSGSYLDSVLTGNCFRIDTVRVNLLLDTVANDTLTICAGDSVLIFGVFETLPGLYTRTFQRSNGCDSIRNVLLTVRDTFFQSSSISICAGDSVLIFGRFESQPGTYRSGLVTENGCDSTLQITLDVNTLTIAATVVQETCSGVDAGAMEVTVSDGLPPFSYSWSTGDTTARVNEVPAGNYQVVVTDANGCTAASDLTVGERTTPQLDLEVFAESCPGANDGTLLIAGEVIGQAFSINGSSFGSALFYSGLIPGDYNLSVRDSLGCDQELTFTIDAATGIFLDLPDEFTVTFGDSVTITPNSNASSLNGLIWSVSAGELCTGCPNLTIRPEESLEIFATLPDSSGCPVADTTTVRIVRDDLFYVPNAFSPNGDGVNDRFRVYPGPAVEEILRLAVYDRWGGEVFLQENTLPTAALDGWDGTRTSGSNPSVGVYVYQLEVRLFNNEVIRTAGEILVMR